MADTSSDRQPVWDLPVRFFHWALVAMVTFQAITGLWGGPAEMEWHGRVGLTILTLVLFRLIWGVVGGRHARFNDFVRGPKAIIGYLRASTSTAQNDNPPGHNPLGGWSVLAMLAVLALQAGLGLFANDDILFEGPLMHLVDKGMSDILTGYHQLSAQTLLALVGLHVAVIIIYRLRGKNLLTPMITGYRRTEPSEITNEQTHDMADDSNSSVPVMGSPVKALIVLITAAAVVLGILNL